MRSLVIVAMAMVGCGLTTPAMNNNQEKSPCGTGMASISGSVALTVGGSANNAYSEVVSARLGGGYGATGTTLEINCGNNNAQLQLSWKGKPAAGTTLSAFTSDAAGYESGTPIVVYREVDRFNWSAMSGTWKFTAVTPAGPNASGVDAELDLTLQPKPNEAGDATGMLTLKGTASFSAIAGLQ